MPSSYKPPLVDVDVNVLDAGDVIAVFNGRKTGERRTKITRKFTRDGHVYLDTATCGRLILSNGATVRAEVPR
jgi:hypothetical protein